MTHPRPSSSPRAIATRAYWQRWRLEQRDRKARRARLALEAAGQLAMDLVRRENLVPCEQHLVACEFTARGAGARRGVH